MAEFAKAVKVVHQVLLLVSAAILAFALTPNKEPLYEKADAALRALQTLNEDGWNRYVAGLQERREAIEAAYLNGVFRRLDHSYHAQRITMFIFSDLHFPISGSLADIKKYMESSQTVKTFALRRDEDSLRRQWDAFFGVPARQPGAPPSPQSALAQSVPPSPRIQNVTVVPPGGSWSGGAFEGVHNVSLLQESNDRNARIQLSFDATTMPAGRELQVLVLNTTCDVAETMQDKFAQKWLLANDSEHVFLRSSKGSSEFLPDLEPFWDEVSSSDIRTARDKLRLEQISQRDKVAVFGLSVDSGSAVAVMPWVVCSLFMFFIAHMRQFRRSIVPSETGSLIAWVGLFDDWTGRFVTFATVLLLPVGATGLLIHRYGSYTREQFVSAGAVLILSLWAYAELVRLRSALRLIGSEPDRSASAEDEDPDDGDGLGEESDAAE